MHLSRRSIWLAASLVLLGAAPAAAGPGCKPALSLSEARTSDARGMQRTWTAVLTADAARCAVASGQFEIQFTRLKEYSLDLDFAESFTWSAGRTVVSIDIWWDEWLEEHRIGRIATCPCREESAPASFISERGDRK
jgi:hypothetical protein